MAFTAGCLLAFATGMAYGISALTRDIAKISLAITSVCVFMIKRTQQGVYDLTNFSQEIFIPAVLFLIIFFIAFYAIGRTINRSYLGRMLGWTLLGLTIVLMLNSFFA